MSESLPAWIPAFRSLPERNRSFLVLAAQNIDQIMVDSTVIRRIGAEAGLLDAEVEMTIAALGRRLAP